MKPGQIIARVRQRNEAAKASRQFMMRGSVSYIAIIDHPEPRRWWQFWRVL